MWTLCACWGQKAWPYRCPDHRDRTHIHRHRHRHWGMRINPAYQIYEDWVVMCANLKLSARALSLRLLLLLLLLLLLVSALGYSQFRPAQILLFVVLVLAVDMLVNWSLADCINCWNMETTVSVPSSPRHTYGSSWLPCPIRCTTRELSRNAGN